MGTIELIDPLLPGPPFGIAAACVLLAAAIAVPGGATAASDRAGRDPGPPDDGVGDRPA